MCSLYCNNVPRIGWKFWRNSESWLNSHFCFVFQEEKLYCLILDDWLHHLGLLFSLSPVFLGFCFYISLLRIKKILYLKCASNRLSVCQKVILNQVKQRHHKTFSFNDCIFWRQCTHHMWLEDHTVLCCSHCYYHTSSMPWAAEKKLQAQVDSHCPIYW